MIQTCFKEEKLELDEGFLCIDYVNTLEWRKSPNLSDRFRAYDDLVDWAKQKKLIESAIVKSLRERAAKRTTNADQAIEEARSFRGLLDKIFSATSAGDLPKKTEMKQFNKMLSRALCHLELVIDREEFRLETNAKNDLLSPILWPIAISAAQLLSSYEIERIGECLDEDGCGYFFYDTSKNHSKKYCGSNCATRAKVRRFRSKKAG